jgi:hypothetical protein
VLTRIQNGTGAISSRNRMPTIIINQVMEEVSISIKLQFLKACASGKYSLK